MNFLIRERINNIRLEHDDIKYYLGLMDMAESYDIHYGYWKIKPSGRINNKEFVRAQNRLSKIVISRIQRIKTVIDVGGGIGGFSRDLKKEGYFSLCIVPDKRLISIGRRIFPDIKFINSSAEFFRLNHKVDTAVLFESLQYFTDKRLGLQNIIRHLNYCGRIIILDEFFKSGSAMNEKKLADFLATNGFILAENINLTERVLPTCDFVIDYSLNRDKNMADVWNRKKKNYSNKDLTYRLLVFERFN